MTKDNLLLAEHAAGLSYAAIAEKYRLNVDSVRSRISRAKRAQIEPPRYTFTGVEPPQYSGQPVFNGQLHLRTDQLMIAGDIHVPSTNYPLMQAMVDVAMKHMKEPRELLICGDLSNGDADTSHAPLAPTISRQNEYRQLEDLMNWLLMTFDFIYLTPGNHLRHRLMNTLKADIGADQVIRLFVPPYQLGRVQLSWYDEVHVTSAGQEYVVCHQYQYRQNKLSIANDLALKYQKNTIVFHQHHTAKGRDKYNRFTIVDCGGLHDQDMMAYVNLVPSTLPRMNNAFVYLHNGVADQLTPYPTYTDWSMWGVRAPWEQPTPPTKRKRSPQAISEPALQLTEKPKRQTRKKAA